MSVVSIIQQFLHPPIGLCTLEALPGNPYSGLNGLQRIRGPVNVDAFGIRWLLTAIPDGYGISLAAGANRADRPVIDIAIRHQLFDGEIVVSDSMISERVAGNMMFNESFPYVVDVELAPGIESNLYWILVL